MFENKDKDLDGRLSFEEFMGEESRAERLFKLMDKDNDGWVTKNVSSHQSVSGCWCHNTNQMDGMSVRLVFSKELPGKTFQEIQILQIVTVTFTK